MRKLGFTLAEVLITLAVVGIVAASTIPAVVTKLTRQEFVTKLQKAHNTLVNTVKAAEKEHGPIEYWSRSLSHADYFNRYLKPHLDIMADCGTTATPDACFPRHTAAGGSAASTDYKNLNGAALTLNWAGAQIDQGYKFTTPDGISYSHWNNTATDSYVYVDVNGKKGPNQLGRDLFLFQIWRDTDADATARGRANAPWRGVKPMGWDQTESDRAAGCSASNTSATSGVHCTLKVLTEGGMNY
ncbi:general secretion pathway protein G [Candidatus Gastranaerophilus sp. (ex Termes propinquus)]|nr:general secretion pathway protein G [Candidatus Gastranaerophilus sp. (ex Termes propinquus)]